MAERYRIVRTRPFPWAWLGLAAAAAIMALWPVTYPAQPDYRAACEAQGGLVVHLEAGGRLCLWAGAVIPVTP